ncbi:GL24964 [Drosophila persimilis]|uniref:GL24964 n=1 Tax=Drosophila persimilis TaxID=7234 RepID=B4GRD4_DROPE|nr:GL24964 [Drosophila persimilis]
MLPDLDAFSKQDKEKDERHSYTKEKPLTYSSNVLVGNWFNQRYQKDIRNGNTILPGLTAEEACERHKTCSQATYTPFTRKETLYDHIESKHLMEGIKESQNSRQPLDHDDRYLNNYTSMNTLMFNMLPKMRLDECLQMEKAGLRYQPSQLDATQCYGNNSLLRNKIRCKLLSERPNRGATSYMTDFKIKIKPVEQGLGEWTTADNDTKTKDRGKFIFMNCNMHDDLMSLKIESAVSKYA